jgi:uncharacterized protein YndB with AHSA1/START domain/DNA-binding transcriptional ArsR family regulator
MDEEVFKALADPTRRALLDRLFRQDGQSLSQLEEGMGMTRFGVMKHLHLLEGAGLVVSLKAGRERLHYLNPVPIRQIHDRWISKYTEAWAGALVGLKAELERQTLNRPKQVFQVLIRTSPERLWDAITNPDVTRRYYHGTAIESDFRAGSPYVYRMADGRVAHEGLILEADAPRRLAMTFAMKHDAAAALDRPSRVTWEIDEVDAGICSLTVTHDDFDGGTRTYELVRGGKPAILSSLKSLLETGEPLSVTAQEEP